jgi:hypothetical protein
MAINDARFDSEDELERWVFTNWTTFFGTSLLLPKVRIATSIGKQGTPDGIVFNFQRRAWWIVECELLAHGVWQHIAEQVARYVVAVRSPSTLRAVRDKLFEKIIADKMQDSIAQALGTNSLLLLQQLELFIEGVAPSLAILIDDHNQDLLDLCDSLDIATEIYRVKKFIVNGQAEYYSPDRNLPAVTFDSSADRQEGSTTYDAIEQLGGGEVLSSKFQLFRLRDSQAGRTHQNRLEGRDLSEATGRPSSARRCT